MQITQNKSTFLNDCRSYFIGGAQWSGSILVLNYCPFFGRLDG